MNVRQSKKLQIQLKQRYLQEIELIFNTHRERQITNLEAKEILEKKLFPFKDISIKNERLIDEVLEQNKMNNNRHLKRSRLFSAESLVLKVFACAEAMAK